MTTKEHLQKHDKQIERHDKQIAAIKALIREGMDLVVVTRKEMRSVLALHKRTEKKLDDLLNTMRRGSNGHSKKPVDLQ